MMAQSLCGNTEVRQLSQLSKGHNSKVSVNKVGTLEGLMRISSPPCLIKIIHKRKNKSQRHLKTGKLKRLGMVIREVSLVPIPYFYIGVIDLAWCPDNLHFASCGTDTQICIWNINEHCKFSILLSNDFYRTG
jgi:WD40 repeat protein